MVKNECCGNILPMNKRLREFLNGIGLVVSAVAMMAVGIGLIFLIHMAFHAIFK